MGSFENLKHDWIKLQKINGVQECDLISLPWKNKLKNSENINWNLKKTDKEQIEWYNTFADREVSWRDFYDDVSYHTPLAQFFGNNRWYLKHFY